MALNVGSRFVCNPSGPHCMLEARWRPSTHFHAINITPSAMRLHVLPASLVIEPSRTAAGRSLWIDRDKGTIEASERVIPDVAKAQTHFIDGVAGIVKLRKGWYLLAVTKSQVVAKLLGCTISKVLEAKAFPFSAKKGATDIASAQLNEEEDRFLGFITSILNNQQMYFSHDYDLTHSVQRVVQMNGDAQKRNAPMWMRADERFFYNRFLMQPLIERNLHEWIMPLVSGNVVMSSFTAKGQQAHFLLISRRSWMRTGYRFTCRGLDSAGNAANFAETEQFLIVPERGTGRTKLVSYLQTRGSIPLLWAQPPTLKWAPKAYVTDEVGSRDVYTKHTKEQTATYGRTIYVSLIDHKGHEGQLDLAFGAMVESANVPDTRFVSFDFHKECKGMKYENLAKLVAIVDDEIPAMGYFVGDFAADVAADATSASLQCVVSRQQRGAFRTNCMDCLDRTNVVQNVFAEKVLEQQLVELQLVSADDVAAVAAAKQEAAAEAAALLASGSKKKAPKVNPITTGVLYKISSTFAFAYKGIWADNADRMSMLYSGTGALKTDYTRTGKRSMQGAIQDGINSVTRYYLNNFCDGTNQDALDLFHGRYVPERNTPSALSTGEGAAPSKLGLLGRVSLMLGVLFGAWFALGAPEWTPGVRGLVILFVLADLAVTGAAILKRGRKYVNKPRLVPEPEPVAGGGASKTKPE